MGTLYYGDRRSRFPFLDILRRYVADASVDLVLGNGYRVLSTPPAVKATKGTRPTPKC